MSLSIIPVYAGIFGLALMALSVRVIRLRRQAQVAIGPGEDLKLARAIRVQANFAEYVPLLLLLLAFLEFQGVSPVALHALCLVLIIGRVVHAFGVSQVDENFKLRVFGMVTTFIVLATASLILITGGSLISGIFGL